MIGLVEPKKIQRVVTYNWLTRHKITTIFEAFEAACRKWPDNKCLGWREQDKKTGVWGPYLWIDYKTVLKRRTDLGAGLIHLHESAVSLHQGRTRYNYNWRLIKCASGLITQKIRCWIVVRQPTRMANHRFSSHVAIALHCEHLRHAGALGYGIYHQPF